MEVPGNHERAVVHTVLCYVRSSLHDLWTDAKTPHETCKLVCHMF